jgi:DNA-binding CsgD family transcriptional regulator
VIDLNSGERSLLPSSWDDEKRSHVHHHRSLSWRTQRRSNGNRCIYELGPLHIGRYGSEFALQGSVHAPKSTLHRIEGAVSAKAVEMTEIILSPREKLLLRRLARGMSDRDIALKIGGTDKQIAEQKARLIGRLGIKTGADLTEAATRFAPWPKPS